MLYYGRPCPSPNKVAHMVYYIKANKPNVDISPPICGTSPIFIRIVRNMYAVVAGCSVDLSSLGAPGQTSSNEKSFTRLWLPSLKACTTSFQIGIAPISHNFQIWFACIGYSRNLDFPASPATYSVTSVGERAYVLKIEPHEMRSGP